MYQFLSKKVHNKKGFTLIELIVVIAILGILAAILIPKFTGFQDKAHSTQALVEAKQWATAADAYVVEKDLADAYVLTADDIDAIDTVAGTDGTVAAGASVSNNHVGFTYTTLDTKYEAVRDAATGEFTLTVN